MKALLDQAVLVILCCIVTVATKTNDVNLCKRQPFRGRCPSVKGKGLTRSQFVLRYYLRDNECVSYPFGHCADDENEPMLYRYKEDCEKACINKMHNSGTINANGDIVDKSESSLDSKITDSDTDEQISTTLESFSENDFAMSTQRAAFATQKITSHKLLTECERYKQASEAGLINSDFIPVCTADGSFRPLQCETQGEHCFCVDRNGVKIPNSYSNGTKKPNCKQIMKAQKPLIQECSTPMDSGPCTAAITRWYYSNREQHCIQFEYSGCGGNGNNYLTKAACEKQCKRTISEEKCNDGQEPLKNDDGHLVSCNKNPCPDGYLCSVGQLNSACCPVNASSTIATIHLDVIPDICQLPKERGPCDRYELRFYYNSRLGECKYFFFGGCEGNGNNFDRVEECERICRQHGVKIASASVVSAPQLITSGPQVRKLNKESGTKSIKKASEVNELVELSDAVALVTDKNNTSTGSTDNDVTTNEAILKTKQIDTSSSATISHESSFLNKDIGTATTDTKQRKPYLSQKIGQTDRKKVRQKGTKTWSSLGSIDKLTNLTIVEPENTSATLGSINSDDESNKSERKFSSESVVATSLRLSSSEEQVKTSTSTLETTMTDHANVIIHGEEKLSDSDSLRSLSLSTPLISISTTSSQSNTAATTEAVVPEPVKKIDDRCFHSRDRGTCTGQFIRWHWDSKRNTCQVFTYSGCGGNGNNFRSREDCFAACHQPTVQPLLNMDNVCEHSIHPGDCTGVFQRFAFDSTIGDCRSFTYTGCGGNGNNFGSSLECRNKCVKHKAVLATDVCQHPIDVGECSGVFPRFAYDLTANECRPFTYGGCGGNGNNFGSMAECKTKCVRERPAECPLVNVSLCIEPCILFSNRLGCHECTCPVVQSIAENGLVEPDTPSSTISNTSSSVESKSFVDEQLMQNNVEKKPGFTSHSEKTSQTNSVIELGEKCSQPMDAGPCKNFIERWFFDISSGLCQSFQYGGCAGNRNHFFSQHECEIHCARFFNGHTGRRRIAAYQSASHAQHNTLTWSQSAEIQDEHGHEGTTQQNIIRDSSDDINNEWKPVISSTQNGATQTQITTASRSGIILAQRNSNRWIDNRLVTLDKIDTQTESTRKDILIPMNSSKWNHAGDLTHQQKQSQTAIQKIDTSQTQQQNGLSQKKLPVEKLLQNDEQMFQKHKNVDITSLTSNIFDSQIAKQMLTDLAAKKNSDSSDDERRIRLPPQAEISESQIIAMMANGGKNENKLKTKKEKAMTKKALINNSTFNNSVYGTDRSDGRLVSEEMSMESTSPRFEIKDEMHMQLNNVDMLWKEHNQFTDKITNDSIKNHAESEKDYSQSVSDHLLHKQYGNAIATAADRRPTYLSRDSVLQHHVRIINIGSALDSLSRSLSNSSSLLSVSSPVLPTLPPISSLPPSTILKLSSSQSTPSPPLSFKLSPHSPLIPFDTKTHPSSLAVIFQSNMQENFTGARGTNLQHAVDEEIAPSHTEEFSHDSVGMHINTREHEDQTSIETKLPIILNNLATVIDSVDDRDLPTVLPAEWNIDSNEYRIIDKIDTTLEISSSHESLTSTTTSTTIPNIITRPAQSVMEKTVLPIASTSIILNSPDAVLTSFSPITSVSHSVRSSVTVIPTNINTIPISFETIKKSDLNSSVAATTESTITENEIERSFESSVPTSPHIISQPIPSGKSWLYDGLQSIRNSQLPVEQHSQQTELSQKKLSFDSFDPVEKFAPSTFNTAIINNNSLFIKKPQTLTNNTEKWFNSDQKLRGMDIAIRNIKLQKKKRTRRPEKSKEFDETRYFNVDSSIFMNAPSFQNQNRTAISFEGIRNDNIMAEYPEFTSNGAKEMEKERDEGMIGIIDLSPESSTSMYDFNNMSLKNTRPKSMNDDILHQFASTIQETSPEKVPSAAQSNSQSDMTILDQDHRLDSVEDRSLHPLKHQQLHQPINLNTKQHFIASHDIQMAQSIPSRINVKQGESEEVIKDRIIMDAHKAEIIESEAPSQRDISDTQVLPETTHLVLHGVTSLQHLQLEQDDTCVLPPDAGICRDYVPRWFYNSQTGKCEQFSYGSCDGNSNNFLDRHACEAKCSQGDSVKSQFPEQCTHEKDEGHGSGYYVKWYFNVRNLRCEQMVYQGQGGNSNQFETLDECQMFCKPLNAKVLGAAKQIEHSLKTTSINPLQQNFATFQEYEKQKQQSVTEINKISEGQHDIHGIFQNASETYHRMISDNASASDKDMQPISSEQHSTLSNTSTQSPLSATPSQRSSHTLDISKSETITVQESPEPSQFTNFMNQNGTHDAEKEVIEEKTLTEKIIRTNNDAISDLPNILEDVRRAPSCPNGLKPVQHPDGRPMMCLPGRNQCSGNSLCYFNGVDFFCCPNAEDPYDEHIFGGYGGEEVKRGYKNVKKTPINANELIVRKLRLKRQAQVFTSSPLTINKAARIDSKVPKYSLARASFPIADSDVEEVNDFCMQDLNKGTCSEAHLRFFYDHKVGICRLFYYSGCNGNDNNFATEEECRQKCKDKVYIEDAAPGSCPFGEPPLGDNAPVICGKEIESFECPKGYYCRMGPPNVCCLEKSLPVLEKTLMKKKSQKNIRFSPKQSSGNPPGYLPNDYQKESEASSPLLMVPTDICPDGSNALLDESTGQPLKCGSGYDGSFCPVGYYCSIDSEKNGRLCCELGMLGVKIPPPPIIPPYFGLRPSNPGEVIARGSLPSDYVSEKHKEPGILSNVAESSEGYRSRLALSGTKLATDVKLTSDSRKSEEETEDSSENLVPSEPRFQDEVYGRMVLKSNDQNLRPQAFYNVLDNVVSPEAETNEVQIDVGEMKDPFELMEYAQKTTSDRSICFLKPSEGRTCLENESPPRTNLQYFYSNRDKRCKLYFYRGCGGSQNRFDTKRHCEMTCGGV